MYWPDCGQGVSFGLAVELESPAGGLLAVRVLDVDVLELGGEEGGRAVLHVDLVVLNVPTGN